MSKLRQTNLDAIPGGGIAAPNEPHMACVLLLDTSESMNEALIDSLDEAIESFINQTSMDELVMRRVDVAIVEFNDDVRVVQNFTPLSQMEPVSLTAGGASAMGEGINMAIDIVKERLRFYDMCGTPSFIPWIFMITDGAPTDDISLAMQRIQEEENKGKYGKLKFWALGVPGYDKELLKKLSKRVIEFDGKSFKGIFNGLSECMERISVSKFEGDERILHLDW